METEVSTGLVRGALVASLQRAGAEATSQPHCAVDNVHIYINLKNRYNFNDYNVEKV